MLKHAIVRTPGANFAEGLTTADFGTPRIETVLHQHARYCEALEECGLEVTTLEADPLYPDSAFVEDTAVLTERTAILTRPGANSRMGEVTAIRATVERFFATVVQMEEPGTLDGGDICEAENVFFLGLSHRTNEEGVRQLSGHLANQGYTWGAIDIRGRGSILHLKSGISYIGNNTMMAMEEMAENTIFRAYDLIRVPIDESYAANCIRVNEHVLVPAGYPRVFAELSSRGFNPLALEMSEFQKMDGGLSCLSLRF